MGGFCSCFHVPDARCFCPRCLLHKLKNKMQHENVCTDTQTNDASSPNQQASSANPTLPLNAASAANNVAVSSDGESGTGSLQKLKSHGYAEALSSGLDSFEHMFPSSDDVDECPTCLEEYTTENPKIMSKCNHHYHLSCIYEWMERNENCPVCGKLMLFEE